MIEGEISSENPQQSDNVHEIQNIHTENDNSSMGNLASKTWTYRLILIDAVVILNLISEFFYSLFHYLEVIAATQLLGVAVVNHDNVPLIVSQTEQNEIENSPTDFSDVIKGFQWL